MSMYRKHILRGVPTFAPVTVRPSPLARCLVVRFPFPGSQSINIRPNACFTSSSAASSSSRSLP